MQEFRISCSLFYFLLTFSSRSRRPDSRQPIIARDLLVNRWALPHTPYSGTSYSTSSRTRHGTHGRLQAPSKHQSQGNISRASRLLFPTETASNSTLKSSWGGHWASTTHMQFHFHFNPTQLVNHAQSRDALKWLLRPIPSRPSGASNDTLKQERIACSSLIGIMVRDCSAGGSALSTRTWNGNVALDEDRPREAGRWDDGS
ncbi:hypothetical protein QBC41DRAFT_327069, partial [Cercophora samala]